MPSYLESRPCRGRITNPFGAPPATPTSPPSHLGQDYGWGGGDAIFAARGGIVTGYGTVGSYGNRLVIQHGRSAFGSNIETWYCHLTRSLVGIGDVVDAGQEVAVMGATGNVTAKHLHFELRIDGRATDPEDYFSGSAVAGIAIKDVKEEPTPEEEHMFVKAKEGYGFIPAGWSFQISGDGRWRALSREEASLVVASGYKIFEWSGLDCYNHACKAGLWEFTGAIDSADPGQHTGRLLIGGGAGDKRLPGEVLR